MISRLLLFIVMATLPVLSQASCPSLPRVALTFDDGPHRTLTPRVLEALAIHGASATFFLVGNRIRNNAGIVRRMHDEGHEIGTHTQDHTNLLKLSPSEAHRQITMARGTLSSVFPDLVAPLWRAPYGSLNKSIMAAATTAGMTHVSWKLDVRDYLPRSTMASEIVSRLSPGDIVLLHDIQPGTVSQLPWLLQSIADKGYKMVTVSDLWSPAPCRVELPPQVPEPWGLDHMEIGELIP